MINRIDIISGCLHFYYDLLGLCKDSYRIFSEYEWATSYSTTTSTSDGKELVVILNSEAALMASASVTSPFSVNSNFSFSDSVSDIVALDMSDDYTKPPPEDVFTFRSLFEREGSLNSSMITIVVSLQGMLQLLYTALRTSSSTGRQHPLSYRLLLPPKRIGVIEVHHFHLRGRPNPPAKHYRRRVQSLVEVLLRRVSLRMQPLINTPLIQAAFQGCMMTTSPPLRSG